HHARHVAGEIHPLDAGNRVGDKAAGGAFPSPKIALRQLADGALKLPRNPRLHRAHRGIVFFF
ncbi:hypothetical protein DY003_29445, partial [Klebsiella variicola]